MQYFSRGLFFLRRPILDVDDGGIVVEQADLISWQELNRAGAFTNDLASGLGLRLTDPVEWFGRTEYRRGTQVGSVLSLDRGPKSLRDLMGSGPPSLPSELPARIEWARQVSGGWDLSIPAAILADSPEVIAVEIMRRKADQP